MAITVSIGSRGPTDSQALAELRAWLEPADGQDPWQLVPAAPPPDDNLGAGVGEICLIITAAAQIPVLVNQIRAWFPTRPTAPRISFTFTLDPGAEEQSGDEHQA
jgi:hypothetical protein